MEIGDKLSGRYLLTDFIGQGGMANVFLAQDLILERQVAVKVLRFDFQDNQDAIRRFQREAMSLANCCTATSSKSMMSRKKKTSNTLSWSMWMGQISRLIFVKMRPYP